MSKNREIQKVSVIMGSQSDYSIMKESIKVLKRLDINFEKK